jgi:hypothetical protein
LANDFAIWLKSVGGELTKDFCFCGLAASGSVDVFNPQEPTAACGAGIRVTG